MPTDAGLPPDVISAGYLLFREAPHASGAADRQLQFLLMQHSDRWDLPKGHVDAGETIEQAAARELVEETGIAASDVWTDPDFRFDEQYDIQRRGQIRRKQLIIYLGWLGRDRPLHLTEHIGYRWFPWAPPHKLQLRTIDPLLAAVAQYLNDCTDWPPASISDAPR